MAYWLVKSEPDECGIDHFVKADKPICWDGVRNYQARNFLRDMAVGDQVLLYHSSCKEIGLAGIVQVASSPYPDPTQFISSSQYFDAKSPQNNPRWTSVDMIFVEKFSHIVGLSELKANAQLEGLALIAKGGRLSVMPVSAEHWHVMLHLARNK